MSFQYSTPAYGTPPQPPLTRQAKDWMRNVLTALDDIKAAGDFATFQQFQPRCPLRLSVKDVGDISMPLCEDQARQIIDKARLAPFGKGSETIVDTSVRNTWELNPDQFELGTEWAMQLHAISRKVAADLGIQASIRAELYKMLIYEQGAMFKPHTDTEKTPGMFGTLVISLDSSHTGGQVRLRHQGQEKTFDTSACKHAFAAWYGDVTHEVLPVQSGYRWVLTYNLALDSAAELPSASSQASLPTITELENQLRVWASLPQRVRVPTHVYYALDHKYTEANISLAGLKHLDLARVQTLHRLSKKVPIRVFLSVVEKEVTHSVDEYWMDPRMRENERDSEDDEWDSEDDDRDYDSDPNDRMMSTERGVELENICFVKRIVELDGSVVLQDAAFNEKNFLQPDCFDPDNADEEEESGFTGNEGATSTLMYNIAAAIIVPEDSVQEFLYFSNGNTISSDHINHWVKECDRLPGDNSAFNSLFRCWEMRPHQPTRRFVRPTGPTTSTNVLGILAHALRRQELEFFQKVAKSHGGDLNIAAFEWLRDYVDQAEDDDCFDKIREGLSSAVLAYPSLREMAEAIQTFSRTCEDSSRHPNDQIHTWRYSIALQVANLWQDFVQDRRSAAELLPVIDMLEDPVDFIKNNLAVFVDRKASFTPFWFDLLKGIHQRAEIDRAVGEKLRQPYQILAQKVLLGMDMYKVLWDGNQHTKSSGTQAQHEDLAGFIVSLHRMCQGGEGQLQNLLWDNVFAIQSTHLTIPQLDKSWVPFLGSLSKALQSKDSLLSPGPRLQSFYKSILSTYIEKFVGSQPSQLRSNVREKVRCSCAGCELLNRFLIDPSQVVGSFALNGTLRKHMEREIHSRRLDCKCTTVKAEKAGKAHQLKVTKTFAQLRAVTQVWQRCRETAEEKIAQIDCLNTILADDYEGVMKKLRATGQHALSERVGAANRRRGVAAKRQYDTGGEKEDSKRRRQDVGEVIDLVSD